MQTALKLDQILMFTDRSKGRAAFAANGIFCCCAPRYGDSRRSMMTHRQLLK
jgi:hypothetical protein